MYDNEERHYGVVINWLIFFEIKNTLLSEFIDFDII